MLFTIVSAFLYTEIKDKSIGRLFSGILNRVLNKWQLQVMVLSSLILQFVLVFVGNRRKFQGKYSRYVAIVVWSTYLMADWVATVALSTLLKEEKKDVNCVLVLVWTPFLLLHLGGPDTISAYSLSDNELWLRYLLGFIIQVGVAVFVFIRFGTSCTPTHTHGTSYSTHTYTYMAIPIFIVGVIKYVERIWILRAASRKQFTNSIFISTADQASSQTTDQSTPVLQTLEEYLDRNVIEEGRYIHKAFCMFKMSIPLFQDLKLKIPKDLSKIFILSFESADDAFRLVEVELGFLYDVLYTKKTSGPQPIVGIILHSICFLSIFTSLIAFSIVVGKSIHSKVNTGITYMLFVGAIFLNIYSTISKACSNWTMRKLTIPSNWMFKLLGKGIVSWYLQMDPAKKKQGIAYMAQHSLMDNCLQTKGSTWRRFVRFFDTEDILGKLVLTSWKEVNHDVRNFIHLHLVKKQSEYSDGGFQYKDLLNLLHNRGDGVLRKHNLLDRFCWSITGLEFDHCLLIWHMATDLLFHTDLRRYSVAELGLHCKISKQLSDYMMYLLLVRPNMLPKGIGELRMKETQNEMMRRFKNKASLSSSEVVNALLGIDFRSEISSPQSPSESKSVIVEGCELASALRSLVEEPQSLWDHSAKWEFIADVWMEIMAFAASRCEWREHKTQLRHGGELLTHVALLMAHFGLTERIEIRGLTEENNSKLLRFDSTRLGWDWDQFSHLPYYLA